MKTEIAVGIITYNPNLEKLQNNIENIINDVTKIYIFDNSQTHFVSDFFNQTFISKKILIIDSNNNQGIAVALNEITRHALADEFEWILTLDQDSNLPVNSIEKYLNAIELHGNDAAIFCPNLEKNYSDKEFLLVKECITSGSLVKIDAWKHVGGYDSKMFIDFVDFDFCYRINKSGYKIYKINMLYMKHELGESKKIKLLSKSFFVYNHNHIRNYYYVRNSIYYSKKVNGIKTKLRILSLMFYWEFKKIVFEKNRFNSFKSFIKGLIRGIQMKVNVRDHTVREINTAVFFHDSNYLSGATRSMFDLIDGIDDIEINFTLIFPSNGTATEYAQMKGYKYLILKYNQMRTSIVETKVRKIIAFPIRMGRYYYSKFFIARKIAKMFNNEKIDVIYSNTSTIFIGLWTAQILKVKHIWHLREFGIEDQKYKHFLGLKSFKNKLVKSSLIIVISKALQTKYKDNMYNQKIHVVYDDLSQNYINPTNRDYIMTKKRINILSVGSIIEGKGHKEIIKAVNELDRLGFDIKLSIAGNTNTSYFEELIKYVDKLELSDLVSFLGEIVDMNELRKNYEIAIIASHSEAFGRVTIESMLSNMVVIAANSGANSELINPHVGCLYETQNHLALTEKIMELYKDRIKMLELSRNSFNYAQKFVCRNASAKIASIIKDLVIYE